MSAASLSYSFDFTRIVVRTFQTIRRNLAVFATLTLVLYGIPKLGASMADMFTHASGRWWFPGTVFSATEGLYGLAAAVGYFVLQAAVVHGAASDLAGRPADIKSCLKTGVRFFWPLLGLLIVMFLGILGGLIALVVPGLMLLTMWLVAVPAEVVENAGVSGALRRSAYLTSGYRWPIFGMIFVFGIVSSLFNRSMSEVQDGFFHAIPFLGAIPHYVGELTKDVFEIIAGLIGSVGVASIYFELRMIKEGAEPEEMVELLDTFGHP